MFDPEKDITFTGEVMMSPGAIEKIHEYIKPGGIMLEWGSGGSTLEFSKNVKKYYSIEHSKRWFKKIQRALPNNVVHKLVLPNNEIFADRPKNKEDLLDYINIIDHLGVGKYDNILVDGRGRGWCAEKARSYLKDDGFLFIDDYFERPQYHIIERWYKLVDAFIPGLPNPCDTPSWEWRHKCSPLHQTLAIFKKR